MQNFGVMNKEHYGMVFSMVVNWCNDEYIALDR